MISTGYVLNVAAVPVTILSVDATPMSPEPSPIKDDAVIIPDALIFLEVMSPVVIWSLAESPTFPVLP